MIIDAERVEKTLDNYIRLEKITIKKIENDETMDRTSKRRLKNIYNGRLMLLKELKYDLLE